MSEFKVEVVRIENVYKHPNADTLMINVIGGFECISNLKEDGTPRYKAGDLVVYIPEAAVVPDWLLQKMNFWKDGKGTLSGSKGNRVKAVKLRGVVSQGILYGVYPNTGDGDCEGFVPHLNNDTPDTPRAWLPVREGTDCAEFLGITKYEPEVPVSMRGQVGSLFGYTKSYDIENLQKNMNVFVEGEEVVATEKLHGTLCQIGFLADLPEEKQEEVFKLSNGFTSYVTSKGLAKSGLIQKNSDSNQDNIYVKAYKTLLDETNVAEAIAKYAQKLGELTNSRVRLYVIGEIFGTGVQDLGYGKPPTFKVFDVFIDLKAEKDEEKRYLNDAELDGFCNVNGLQRVPILYRGPFSIEKMKELRDGNTVEGNGLHIREGIVIRTTEERYGLRGLPDGRAQLKYINPDYLTRKGGSEFN